MTPDYISPDGTVTLYRADCRTIPTPDADLILTDPPYGISHPCDFGERGRANMASCSDWPDVHDDGIPFDPAWLLAIDKPTILWGGNHYADKLPPSSGWLVWDKLRPDTLDQSTCELAWTNCIKGVRRFRHLWHGCMRHSERGESFHPTQKPVALFDWCLTWTWVSDSEHIFDPYMGAGPCAVACIKAGKRYTGVEINQSHFDTAVKRIEQAFADQALFVPQPVETQAVMFEGGDA